MSQQSSRRCLLGALSVLASLPVVIQAAPAAAIAPPAGVVDPVVGLWARAKAANKLAEDLSLEAQVIRGALVRQYGEPRRGLSADSLWGHDPAYPDLRRLIDASDAACRRHGDLIEEMIAMPARTAAGMTAKLQLAKVVWPSATEVEEEGEQTHEAVALSLMQDVTRMLNGGAA